MPPAPHVFTLTGNLLCERTLEFSAWSIGRTQRATRQSFQVGGKGINVSKMLERLAAPTTALCFTGGATGLECEQWLRAQKFAHHAFACSRETRVGIVIRGGQHAETTFMGVDAAPDLPALAACAAFLDAQPDGQILALCGSVPGWVAPEFDVLRSALDRWLRRGTLVADTYGPPLAWAVTQPLDLVKINAAEFRTLATETAGCISMGDGLGFARKRWPARRWIVTDGGGPVWFCDESQAPAMIQPPPIAEISPTGSGDVFLACVLEFYFRKKSSLGDAVASALPYAAANAANAGIADFPLPL